MNMYEIFSRLRTLCGSHTAAARWLGFSPEHYRGMRNGWRCIPPTTAEYIAFKADELSTKQRKKPTKGAAHGD